MANGFDPNIGAIIALGLALICVGFVVLLVLESFLLEMHERPITSYTRNAILKWPGQSITIAGTFLFIVGALVAHFFWDAMCG